MKEIKRNWWFVKLQNDVTKNIQGALITKARKIYNSNSVIDFDYEIVEDENELEFTSKVLSLANNEDINYVSFTVSNEDNQIEDDIFEKLLFRDNKLQDIIDLWNNNMSEEFIDTYLNKAQDIDILLTLKNIGSFDCDCRKFSKSGKICEHIVASILTFLDEVNYNPQILFDLIGLTREEIRNNMFASRAPKEGSIFSDFLKFPFFLNYENGFIDNKENSNFSEKDKINFYNNISEVKNYYGNDKNQYMQLLSRNIGAEKSKKVKKRDTVDIFNYVDKIDSVYYNTIGYIKAVIGKRK